jgi:hypothetical protein
VVVLRVVAKGGLHRSRPVDEEMAVVEEGGRRRARVGAPVVNLPRGWEHLLGGDVGLKGR